MNKEIRSDEVSLLEIVNVLQRYKWLLLIVPFVCVVFAVLLISVVLHPKWEASAILEIGRMGQAAQSQPVLVEPAASVVVRMLHPSFVKGALQNAGVQPEEFNAFAGFYNTAKVTIAADADLIEVKLRGPSAETAKNLLKGAVVNLQIMHEKMLSVSIERNIKQREILDGDIKKLSVEIEMLRKKLSDAHDWSAFDATLAATILKDKSAELREMIQKKLQLDEQMSPERTFTTKLVNEIYVSDAPVSPNKPLVVGLAVLLGVFGAVVFAFAHHAITKSPS